MATVNLDIDLLRTLVHAQELGSFNRAADRVGRSQSAVSQQMRKLEERVGVALFRKEGRGLALTDAGSLLLAHAVRLLALNDDAVAALRGAATEGIVRFGLPIDFAESWLPIALGRFGRAHPAVRFEAVVDRNRRLLERLDQGELDLALAINNVARRDAAPVGSLPLAWLGSSTEGVARASDEPIALALLEAPCFFRDAALATLDRAGVRWRVAYTSPSLHGLLAGVQAGLGVTLRTPLAQSAGIRQITGDVRLPPPLTSAFGVSLHDGGRPLEPAAARLRDIVVESFALNAPLSGGCPDARTNVASSLSMNSGSRFE
jgi:DNA-binding transcriptional LysR family regulator